MNALAIFAIACAVLAGECPDDSPKDAGKYVPSARSIIRELNREEKDIGEAYLLAFKAEIDDRPLYVESALLALKTKANRWELIHAFRHPKEKNRDAPHWWYSIVTDSFVEPLREYDHRPSKDEVETFLRNSWWEFRPMFGFRLLRGEVFVDAWEKAFGFKTEHRFPMPDK